MLVLKQDYVGIKARVKFNGDCSKEEKITFNHGKIVNIYIVYKIERSVNINSYPTLENCLFGASDSIEKDLIQLMMKLEEM